MGDNCRNPLLTGFPATLAIDSRACARLMAKVEAMDDELFTQIKTIGSKDITSSDGPPLMSDILSSWLENDCFADCVSEP